MEQEFKHPQIFADVLTLIQLYYPMHHNLPKPFRFAVGERILAESAQCLRAIVLANAADKTTPAGCAEGLAHVRQARAAQEVIRGFLLLAWKLKFISHGALAELSARLEAISTLIPAHRDRVSKGQFGCRNSTNGGNSDGRG